MTKNPKPNTQSNAIFVRRGSCRFQTPGIGKERIITSVIILAIPVPNHPACTFPQTASGMLWSQFAAIGRQFRQKKRRQPMQ